MDRQMARDLDNWITGHYGEDQFRDEQNCSSVFDEGGDARRNGLPIKANPYEKGTPDHREWDYGWTDEDMSLMDRTE